MIIFENKVTLLNRKRMNLYCYFTRFETGYIALFTKAIKNKN